MYFSRKFREAVVNTVGLYGAVFGRALEFDFVAINLLLWSV